MIAARTPTTTTSAAATKPAVAYLRRSTDRQEQSLTDQRKEIQRWAEYNGYRLSDEYIDDAISGTTARARPAFQQMITDARKGEFTAVIVWNSDRFSRGDGDETGYYRHLLRQAGVTVLSVTEDFLARDGIDGDVLRAVKQFQNRQFSINLSQNTLRGQISAVLSASDPGRLTPYGYDREIRNPDGTVIYRVRFREGGDREVLDRHGAVQATYSKGQSLRKPGKSCTARLVLSEQARVRVVRDIYRMCIDGVGFKGIADELNRRGVMSPKGRLWQHTTVKALVENPVYRGDLVWNRRTESKFYEVRQGRADRMKTPTKSGRIERVDPGDWIVLPKAVPAIVDRRSWDRAQRAVAARGDHQGGTGKQTSRWLLSGVMRCGCCGQPFWGIRKRKGRKPGRKDIVTPYYICAGRTRCGKSVCAFPIHVRAKEFEAWVLDKLQQTILSDNKGRIDAVEKFVRRARRQRGSSTELPRLRKEAKHIEATLGALVSGLDPANVALLNERLTSLRRRRERVLQLIQQAQAEVGIMDEKAIRRWAAERLTLLREIVEGRRDEKARQALASYVDEIVVNPEDKTGWMTLNADACGNGCEAQKACDPPEKTDGSHVEVAGAGFEPATFGL